MSENVEVTQNNGNLDDPKLARLYVERFAPIHLGKTATYVSTNNDRLIHFKTMSDEDAVWIAKQFQSWLPKDNGIPPNTKGPSPDEVKRKW